MIKLSNKEINTICGALEEQIEILIRKQIQATSNSTRLEYEEEQQNLQQVLNTLRKEVI